MNIHDRRRKLTIGISFIEEVIADVLREHSGDAPFSTKRVCDLVGFKPNETKQANIGCVMLRLHI